MSAAQPFTFHRPALASQLADALLGRSPFGYGSGLFLAAPRRTGKSTFLRQDLVPELERRGLATLYVDLWSDRQRDPASLIADVVKSALRASDNRAVKVLKASGLSKIGLGPFASFDIDKLGTPQGATLADALAALARKTGKPVALVIDEAQHALASDAGVQAMFALKAARDAMNQTQGEPNLTLVFTGSHRDKLSNLMLRRDQPFFGAGFLDFPLLGRDYCDAYCAWLNERLAPGNRFEPDDVFEAFAILGCRPELLQNVLRDEALGMDLASGLKQRLAGGAKHLRERLWEDFDREFAQLTDVQKAALKLIAEHGDRFSPFAAETLAIVSDRAGQRVESSQMQAALDGLRHKNIVWRSARATYALEDQALADWLLARNA